MLVIALFILCAAVIAFAGTRMTRIADEIADVTGLGEAMVGALFLGACTSLSGTVTSMSAAWNGNADLAVSNAIGGIAVQTFFLAIADMTCRKGNLEHVAASLENMGQCTLFCLLLSLPMLAIFTPEISIWHIHPMSILLFAGYLFGIYQLHRLRALPMWQPRSTQATSIDAEAAGLVSHSMLRLWGEFGILALCVAVAGYTLSSIAPDMTALLDISQSLFGMFFTSIATSLPELITVLAAIRRGAYTLAVGGIIGGNTFDVLFLAFSDFTYFEGSIYHTVTDEQLFMVALCIVMACVLLLGMIRRERHGMWGIGFESIALLVLYAGGMVTLFFKGS